MATVKIPDDVLNEAKRIAGAKSSSAVVVNALKEFTATRAWKKPHVTAADRRKIIKMFGTFREDFMAGS
jgi:hypothetical protein